MAFKVVADQSVTSGQHPKPNLFIYMKRNVDKQKFAKDKGKKAKRVSRKASKAENWRFKAKISNMGAILHSILPVRSPLEYQEMVEDIRNLITSLVQNHGFDDGAARYNILKQYTIDLIEKRNPQNPGWLSTSDKYRVPSKLGRNTVLLIVEYLKCTDAEILPKYFQVINTMMNIHRMVDGLTSPQFKTVTMKASSIDEELLESFTTYVEKVTKSQKYDPKDKSIGSHRVSITKNGPNGAPKVETAEIECVSLLQGKLNIPFSCLCRELGIEYLYSYLLALKDQVLDNATESFDSELKATILRKLVSTPDSGFKTRLVAIPDFWTQLALLPFREHITKVTKRLYANTDFRFDQDSGVSHMVQFQKRCMAGEDIQGKHVLDIEKMCFYDISSWTDRFHRDLQKVVVRALFGPKLAEAWAQLVVHCEWYSPNLKRTVKYGQGQGMGTNGSFDIATLTDHLFINFIIDERSSISGLFPNNECYGKVGDDLWIYDPDGLIPEYYGKINLPINLNKSKLYSEKVGSVAEFCSRTFLNASDVSRISPNIISRSKDFRYIPLLLGFASSRGVKLSSSVFPALQCKLKNQDETYFDKLQSWIVGMVTIGKYEDTSVFTSLTIDDLRSGNWLTESTEVLLKDELSLNRLLVSYCIMEILDQYQRTISLESEAMDATYLMPFFDSLDFNEAKDMWNMDMNCYTLARDYLFRTDSVLTPRQIVVAQRLADQITSVTRHRIAPEEAQFGPEVLLQRTKDLATNVNRSSYDEGRLEYDRKRVYNTQFKLYKVTERLNHDFTVLQLDSHEQLDLWKQYCIASKSNLTWVEELIEMSVKE